jgi:predicted glycosyltransferase
LPKLLQVLSLERRFLNRIIKSIKIDALISDNRYGLYNKTIPTVFLTHQLKIQIPNLLINAWVNSMNRHYMQQYSFVWVPDFAGADNLSGELGHGLSLPAVRYIGPLSRLETTVEPIDDYDIVAILSGPEPQRSYFEKKLKQQMLALPLKSLLVQGLPQKENLLQREGALTIQPFADSKQIAALMRGAKLLVARSGYSSLMDMAKMGIKPLLLVPTPGQTEQEYLAKKLATSGAVLYQQQAELDLQAAWHKRDTVSGLCCSYSAQFLERAVTELLYSVKK